MFTLRLSQLLLFLLLASLVVAGCAPASHSLAIAEPTELPVNPATGNAEPLPRDAVTSTPAPLPTTLAASSATAAPLISVTPAPETPEAVVRAFYEWYLAYIGDPAAGTFRNPLVNRAYHDAPYLNQGFVQHIDELLDEMLRQGGGGYDPFLCAQDIPKFVEPELTFARNGVAGVVWRSSFPNQMVTVDLRTQNDGWLISDITCPFDAPGIAKVFYTWYLGYIGDRSSGEFRNPLVDRAYQDHPLLAGSLEQQVTETVAGFAEGGFDPFLLAQDIPQDFSVDPGPEEGTAVVHLQFGPQSVRHLRVTMDETGRRIAGISDDMPSALPASVYTSSDYGFTFSYPYDWVLQEMQLNVAEMPDEWPVHASWLLMPPGVAEALAAQSGPPDPSAPIMVAPFNIELVLGNEQALTRVYGELDGETVPFSNHEATVLQRDPGYTHVIFAHPYRPETWIVFTDWVTTFPGREAQALEADPIWQPLLDSLQFEQ